MAHSVCDYNKEADKLAKSDAEKNNVLIIEDKLLLHNDMVCWRDMPIERNPILMIKGIKDAQFIEEFLMLHRNKVYRQSDLLRIKICCNELPTCANLKKRKPDLYDEDWRSKIIQEYSRDDIDTQELKGKINELDMWDIGCLYDFTFLMKNQVSCQLIELLRCYKITEENCCIRY
ncbi:unnamed protein product [Rhizophagus irregularis]|uniref:RNase H type-1 domain-containing protein n=1 Tax=Rhizophagus irregularis TaxID=588596 RepID=A0A915ZM25_9GLOM|nr:unnamed protein product [Rhizophagus irregularis]